MAVAGGAPAGADVVPGVRITAANVETVKDLVSPGLEWCIRRGFPLTVTETRQIDWPQAYRDATERYSGQVRLGADGLTLRDYVAGLPFPGVDASEHATKASLPSHRFPGEQGWYFNQGDRFGITDEWFTVAALVNAGH